MCGRVCPQERQCESKCVRGIKGEAVAIGRLERFVADYHMEHADDACACTAKAAPNGHRVAIIGSGPSGLSCAGDLVKKGYDVTVFEALHKNGGVLAYGIPEFRLPKSIVDREVKNLERSGVKFVNDCIIGRTMPLDQLFEDGYEAVFIGSGAGLPQFMNIPGENLLGVYSANEYLTRINLMKAYRDDYDTPIKNNAKRIAVIGGGNVAMDAARCAKRMGADEVFIVYRRGRDELPASAEEVHHAEEEGIEFRLLNNPVEILGDADGGRRSQVRQDAARRAGRLRPPRRDAHRGQRVRHGGGRGHRGNRHDAEPAAEHDDAGPRLQPQGLPGRERGVAADFARGRVRRRRRRDGRCHGHPRDGRRQAGRGVDRRVSVREIR